MEKLNYFKGTLLGIAGMFGGAVVNILGGWSEDFATLLILMAIDFVMGFMVASIWKKSTKSESGKLGSVPMFKGLCKKCTALLFVLIAYRLDKSLGTNYIRTAVIIAFIVNELVSIVENAGLMGVPIPKIMMKAIDVLKEKESEGV